MATGTVGALVAQELARRSLGDFLGLLVPEYQQPPHVRLLCEHLEALEAREIRRLIVQTAPRHSKTLHVSQGLPAWYLGRHPSESVILSSYAAELAEANSRRARNFLRDPRYPFETKVSSASAAVGRWNTTSGGGVIAAGVGGGVTGFGADVLVCDDPVKDREAADSEATRESTWRWWNEVALTRLQPGAAIVLCQTRWHEDDLTGRVLDSPGARDWTVLKLPALAEEDDLLGREEGEALWPSWFGVEYLAGMRRELGERAFSALYMQSPTPGTGGVFKRDWLLGRYASLPDGVRIVQAVDSAFKTGVANDYSVVATWAADRAWFYLIDCWRGKVEFPELCHAIKRQAEEHGPQAVLIEDTAAGQSAIQSLKRETTLPIIAVPAKGSKVSRAEAVSPLFEAGKVLLPEQSPPWLGGWIEEHASFPAGKHDDQVDCTSIALERLRGTRSAGGGVGVIHHADRGRRVVPSDRYPLSYAEAKRLFPGWYDPRCE